MAYEKQTWKNGDTITADKLNHIEDGVGNNKILEVQAIMVRENDESFYTLNKTWQEIYDAFPNVYISMVEQNINLKASITVVLEEGEQYMVESSAMQNNNMFMTDSANGYPTSQQQK